MLIDSLFDKVLIAPAKEHSINRLQIVSGFATANMADRHMEQLAEIKQRISIDLIIGMPQRGGIEKAQHYALRRLVETRPYNMDFSCRYVVKGSPVHAKTYCWLSEDKPVMAFAGSANYTLTGFRGSQIEAVTSVDAQTVANFHADIRQHTDNCLSDDIDDKIKLTETRQSADTTHNTVHLSLLEARTGNTPKKSEINWGQRQERDRNQAYINIPADIGRSGFFPERFQPFTVLTDDGNSFIMVRAQDSGKGLHTTQNNALLGEYLRTRMRVPSGEYVTREHLTRYGRTDVAFTKIDDETYLLDFCPIWNQMRMLRYSEIKMNHGRAKIQFTMLLFLGITPQILYNQHYDRYKTRP